MKRTIYVTIGLLLGINGTTYYANRAVDSLISAQEREMLMAVLSGYQDGYNRGRIHTRGLMGYIIEGCFREVDYLQGKAERKPKIKL